MFNMNYNYYVNIYVNIMQIFYSYPLLISPGNFRGPRGILLAEVVNLGTNFPPLPRIPPLPGIPPRPLFPLLPLRLLQGICE